MGARKRLLLSTIVRAKVDDEADMLISVRAASVITSVIKTGTSVTFSVVLFRILGKKIPHPFLDEGFMKKNSAATYSPTKSPWQYHRR